MCLSVRLLRAGEGLGCRQGMLFKTKKETLAQNGKERKQLPVSGSGFLKRGAELSLAPWPMRPGLAGATLGTMDRCGSHTTA